MLRILIVLAGLLTLFLPVGTASGSPLPGIEQAHWERDYRGPRWYRPYYSNNYNRNYRSGFVPYWRMPRRGFDDSYRSYRRDYDRGYDNYNRRSNSGSTWKYGF